MNLRPVIGSIIALAIVLGVALRLTGTSVPVSTDQVRANQLEQRPPAYPPAMGGPDIVQPAPPTNAEIRNRIVNSADLYAAVRPITTRSPTIEKLAAVEALMACADLPSRRRPEAADDSIEGAAADELAARCTGIRHDLRRNGAVEKAIELRMSAEADSSALGRLALLGQRSGASTRLDVTDLALVSEALASRDPVRMLAAMKILRVRLDDGLPDSRLRSHAFAFAARLHAVAVSGPPAAFDYLTNCANAGRCVSDSDDEYIEYLTAARSERERVELERLLNLYRAALQRRASASELLARR